MQALTDNHNVFDRDDIDSDPCKDLEDIDVDALDLDQKRERKRNLRFARRYCVNAFKRIKREIIEDFGNLIEWERSDIVFPAPIDLVKDTFDATQRDYLAFLQKVAENISSPSRFFADLLFARCHSRSAGEHPPSL